MANNTNRKGCNGAEGEHTPLLSGNTGDGSAADTPISGAGLCENDEGSNSLASKSGDELRDRKEPNAQNVASVISVFLLGVFIANADGSIVLATSGIISSEFGDLGSAGWLITSYTLAVCAFQSLYGKLSMIYGRKSTVLVSYLFFTVGCAVTGLGQNMPQAILGRIIAGVGGAGISSLISIIIAEMVPIRDVASWRSYVNIAATTGRSLGGPLGGFLTDLIGWRWSFLGQCPLMILTMALIVWKLHMPQQEGIPKESHITKLRRIDFLGAVLFPVSLVCGLLVLEFVGQGMAWNSPRILFLAGLSLFTGHLFLLVEAFWAKEPIFPLRLLRNRDVILSYITLAFQSGAQLTVMMLIPIYFQVSAHTSVTTAGAHLMPAVIGNALGGILSGIIIKRTGHYKVMSVFGAVSSTSAYLLLSLRWNGNTSFIESLYVFGGGFGMGILLSTSFIAITAGVEPAGMAIASSGLYLSSSVGTVAGLSVAEAVFQSSLRESLTRNLQGIHGWKKILNRAVADIEYVQSLDGNLGRIVTRTYVSCLQHTYRVSVIGGIVAFIPTLLLEEHEL